MEAWLSFEATPQGLMSIEAVSDPLWETLTDLHVTRIAPAQKAAEKSRFDLGLTGQPRDTSQRPEWEAFQGTVFAEDLTLMSSWMMIASVGAETLIRAAEPDRPTQVFLISKTESGFQVVNTETELSLSVETILGDSFSFSDKEMAVLRKLVVGGTVQSISIALGKSKETVRSHIKSVSQKLSVNRQQDIQRVIDNIQTSTGADDSAELASLGLREIKRGGGRRLFYRVYGPDAGFPVVICTDFSGGSYLPGGTAEALAAVGLKAIVLTRAGYGASDAVKCEGPDSVASHCADYLAVLDAENASTFVALGIGTGMALAYTLSLQEPTRVVQLFGLNIYPSVLAHRDALQFKSGMYRVGALASYYTSKTLRVLTKFVIAQAARVRDAKQMLALSNADAADTTEDDIGSYFEEYLKPNLNDILSAKGIGSAADCTYLAIDWAQVGRTDVQRVPTTILHHYDHPFVNAEFVAQFAKDLGADFVLINRRFRASHRDVQSLAKHIARARKYADR